MSPFESLLDRTRFEVVRRSVNRPGSPVTDVLFVESDELMCQMAELLTRPVTRANRHRFTRWLEEGRVTVGTAAAPRGGWPADGPCLDLHSIDPGAACDVLYLPPYYLVHLAGRHAGSFSAKSPQ